MKKTTLSLCTIVAMSSLMFAGGNIAIPEEPQVIIPVVMDEVDESGFYAGIGLSAVSTRDTDASLDFIDEEEGQDRLVNVSFLAGYNVNTYFAAEGRYTTSVADEDMVEISGWSIFAKPQYPVTEDFSIYALLGFGGVTLDGINGYIADVDDTGFQWGLGASYLVMENFSLFADYTSLANDMDGVYHNGALQVDVDAVTAGVSYQF